jgi:hypothetical protein
MAYKGFRALGGLYSYRRRLAKIGYQLYKHIPGHVSMIYEFNVFHDLISITCSLDL